MEWDGLISIGDSANRCYLRGWEREMSRFTVLMLATIALVSCSEGSLLTPELREEEQLDIQTVEDGTLLGPQDEIEISVNRRSVGSDAPEPLEYLLITLRNEDGRTVSETRVEGAPLATNDIAPITLESLVSEDFLSDVEGGTYTLVLEAFRDGEVVASVERQLFVVADPTAYRISGIATYPPSLAPQRTGVAQATVDAPPDADPWLRWTFEEEPVYEGALAEGADQITIEGPAESGAYTLALGVFPHGQPPEGYEGPAPVRQQTRLIVRSGGADAERALGPPESYYALFHFDGTTEDSGVGAELAGGRAVDAEPIGNPELRVSDRLFGYELNGDSGFEVPGVVLPIRGGALSPFSLNLRLRVDELSSSSRILDIEASDSGLALDLSVDSSGLPTLELEHDGYRDRSSPREAVFEAGEPVDLSIAVSPGPTETVVRWYAHGKFISESALDVDFSEPASSDPWQRVPGVSRIAGEGGFVGIIDELGVYFRDETGEPALYTNMYHDARYRELGSTLAYADGFDAELADTDGRAVGSVDTEQGLLVLGGNGSFQPPPLSFDTEVLMVELAPAANNSGGIAQVEFEHRGRFLFSVDSDGTLVSHGGETKRFSVGETLRVRIARGDGTLTVWVGAGSTTIPLSAASIEELGWRIESASGGTVRVESLLAYHEAGSYTVAAGDSDAQGGTTATGASESGSAAGPAESEPAETGTTTTADGGPADTESTPAETQTDADTTSGDGSSSGGGSASGGAAGDGSASADSDGDSDDDSEGEAADAAEGESETAGSEEGGE